MSVLTRTYKFACTVVCVLAVVCLFNSSDCEAVLLPQCDVTGWMTFTEDTSLPLINVECSNYSDSDNVSWAFVDTNDTVNVIGTCGPQETSCVSTADNVTLTRDITSTEQKSTVTVNGDIRHTLSERSVRCAAGNSSKECKIRVIKYGKINCEISVDAKSWSVSVSCNLTEAYSSDEIYMCIWQQCPSEDEFGPSWNTTLGISATDEAGGHSWQCGFKRSLPADEGVYTYMLKIPHVQATTTVGNVTINPPSPPVITGYNTSHVLTVGDSVSLTCTVNGGNPPVNNITFYCLGQEPDAVGVFDLSSFSSTINISSVRAFVGNTTPCICNSSDHWAPDTNRTLEDQVDLVALAAEQALVTSLMLNNDTGRLIVNESNNLPIILRCAASGRPKPSIRVVRVDTGQPLEVDTSHTSGQDENVQQYTLTTSARCQDAAIYRCQASNRAGRDEANTTLFVTCAPQIEGMRQQGTLHNVLDITATERKPISVSFTVVAYPELEVLATPYLFNTTGQFSDVLNVVCASTEAIYRFACTVTAAEPVKINSGFYNITLENTFGKTSLLVNLTVTANQDFRPPATIEISVAAVAGGIVAALIVLIVIFLIFFFLRRRNGGKSETQRHGSDPEDEFEEHTNRSNECGGDIDLTASKDFTQTSADKPSSDTTLGIPSASAMPDDEDELETSFGYASLSTAKPGQPDSQTVQETSRTTVLLSDYVDIDACADVDDSRSSSVVVSMERASATEVLNTGGLSSDYVDIDAYAKVDETSSNPAALSLYMDRSPTTEDQNVGTLSSDYADVDGYSSVGEGSKPLTENGPSSDYADVDGYSSIRESKPAVDGDSSHQVSGQTDDYATADEARNDTKKSSHDQADEYAKVKKKAPDTQKDVYAKVDKSSKRKKPAAAGTDGHCSAESSANVQNHKETIIPEPDAMPSLGEKQDAQSGPGNDKQTCSPPASDYEDINGFSNEDNPKVTPETADDDEYNSLSFEVHQLRTQDTDTEYSHIGAVENVSSDAMPTL